MLGPGGATEFLFVNRTDAEAELHCMALRDIVWLDQHYPYDRVRFQQLIAVATQVPHWTPELHFLYPRQVRSELFTLLLVLHRLRGKPFQHDALQYLLQWCTQYAKDDLVHKSKILDADRTRLTTLGTHRQIARPLLNSAYKVVTEDRVYHFTKHRSVAGIDVRQNPGHTKLILSRGATYVLNLCSATLSKLVSSPFELTKLSHQLHFPMPQSWLSLEWFRGSLVNVLRYIPTSAINALMKSRIKAWINIPGATSYFQKLLRNIVSGGIMGLISLLFVYPLDSIRTLQAAGMDWNWDMNLYCGFALSVAGIFIYRGTYFTLYDTLKPYLPVNNFATSFLLGYLITVSAGMISYPIDTIRRHQMITQLSLGDAMGDLWSHGGFSSFFGGCFMNVLRGAVGAAVLVVFDEFTRNISLVDSKPKKKTGKFQFE